MPSKEEHAEKEMKECDGILKSVNERVRRNDRPVPDLRKHQRCYAHIAPSFTSEFRSLPFAVTTALWRWLVGLCCVTAKCY